MARCPTSAVLLLLLAAGPLAAEPPARPPLPGESAGTGRRLVAADKLVAADQLAAAADEYAHILDEVGDDLVAVGDRLSVPARRLCHLRLAALPPAVLAPYRTRVDPQARKWLDQGAADRDPRPLRRVVEETFCARPAETALDLLGDLAFERGHFHEAERWWRMLARPASEAARRAGQSLPPPWAKPADRPPELELLYPHPKSDVARTRAKQILALLFRGEIAAAKAELVAFRTAHPKAEGHLAGRDGNYADILRDVASCPIPAAPAEDAWPTFAGSAARAVVPPAEPSDPNRLNVLVRDGPAWRFRLDTHERVSARPPLPRPSKPGDKPVSAAEQARLLAFHPVIAGRLVLTADARGVTAFDTVTGESSTWTLGDGLKGLNVELPAPADLRYTLTMDDGLVYARLGAQGLHPAKTGAEVRSFLVCLKLAENGPGLSPVWVREAGSPAKGPPVMFEGAPVVRDGLLHVAATRFEGNQMVTEVRCYSAATDGPPLWEEDVAATRDLPPAPRYRHQLLTLAGRHVVYATHAGAVVALDARTGRRAWAVRYPGAVVTTPADRPVPRDLTPAVYADGRLYVAPADYDRLLCLDPETGQILWERERLEVVHLLGVGSGRLIFTTPKAIRAVGAADGGDEGGWQTPADPGFEGLPSYGRGFLAGAYVFWPTRAGIKVLSQSDGLPPIELIDGPLGLHNVRPGNLAYAGGVLAVADATHLSIYLPPEQRGAGAGEPPDGPAGALGARTGRAVEVPDREPQDFALAGVSDDLTPPLARAWESAERLVTWGGEPMGTDLLLVRGAAPRQPGAPATGRHPSLALRAGGVLVCRDAATGAERWARPVAGSPCWAGRHAGIAVVAGPDAIQGVALSDGSRLWELPAPNAAAFADPCLSAFRLAAGRFFCLQGECRLLALDAASGRVLWQHWAPAARLGADVPGCRFSPHYLATAECVMLQFAGHCRILDARTGSSLRDLPTDEILWAQPPLALSRDRVAVITGRRRIAALDLPSASAAWSYTLPRPDSLTGEPSLLLGGPDALLVVVPRNYGYALQRLDPSSGRPLWADEIALGPNPVGPRSISFDRNSVYYTSGKVVAALPLDRRRDRLWTEALPGPAGEWCLRRAGGLLMAWPAQARRAKFHSRWLTASLELTVTFPPEGRPGRGVPVLLLDPHDGRAIQRLNLVPPVPRAQGRLALGEELTAVPEWAAECSAAAGPVVRPTQDGLVIGWDGKAWALRRDN